MNPQLIQYAHSIQDALQDPQNTIYNLTYILLVLSVLMRNLSWLRVLAIGSGLAKIVFQVATQTQLVETFWESVLVIVNVAQLIIVWWDNRRRQWTPEEKQFIATFDPPLPHSAAATLLRNGYWNDASPGTSIIEEGLAVNALLYISSGTVRIEAGGRPVAQCSAGDFLGEMTWQTGAPATGTVIAEGPVRYLRFGRTSLERAMHQRPILQFALQSSFNHNLIEKLKRANQAPRPATA